MSIVILFILFSLSLSLPGCLDPGAPRARQGRAKGPVVDAAHNWVLLLLLLLQLLMLLLLQLLMQLLLLQLLLRCCCCCCVYRVRVYRRFARVIDIYIYIYMSRVI